MAHFIIDTEKTDNSYTIADFEKGFDSTGYFGVVYKAYSELLGDVAIKTKEDYRSISRSSHKLPLFYHPNLIAILGILKAENGKMIGEIMECMKTSLSKVIHNSESDYDYKQAYTWIQGIATGLNYLHSLKLIHRDIKPHNILLGNNMNDVKICDFDLLTKLDSTLTEKVGTAIYMAPEIMNSCSYGNKVDIYSMSITIWEILHRKPPYDIEYTMWQIMDKILKGLRPKMEENIERENLIVVNKLNLFNFNLIESGWDADPNRRPGAFEFARLARKILSSIDERILLNKIMHADKKQVNTYYYNEIATMTILIINKNDYEPIKVLDRGNYGSVSLMKSKKLGNHSVIKIFNDPFDESNKIEIYNLRKYSSHPNIVRFVAIIKNGEKQVGYAMEYMEGGSLHKEIHTDSNYKISLALSWIQQIALALAYLHTLNVVHQDIKPKNMVLDKKKKILKICDLGTLREIFRSDANTEYGTPQYMAPEAFDSTPPKCSKDIWSLGVTAWEIFHRKLVSYEDLTKYETLTRGREGNLKPRLDLNCFEPIKQLILKMWKMDPEERPTAETIASLINEMEEETKKGNDPFIPLIPQ